METEKPNIFEYTNYRKFLKDSYIYKKSVSHKFSHRYIAGKVNAGSCGWFSDIVNERINLTRTYLLKIGNLFELTGKVRDYFEELVNYNQAVSSEDKEYHLKKVISLNNLSSTQVRKEQFEFYSKWYIPAIRELLFVYDFRDNFKELSKKLTPEIKVKDAKTAIEILLSIGLIRINKNGFYKPFDPILEKDSAFTSEYWGLYMQSNIELARESVYRYKKKERNISAVTVPLSKDSFNKAQEKITELRKLILKLSEDDKNRNQVYQCNIQLFPLSKEQKNES